MNKYAVCLLKVIPVRAASSDTSEIVTQLLFGNSLEVLEKGEVGSWCKVRVFADGYEGWVDEKQITVLSEDVFNYYNSLPYRFSLGDNSIVVKAGQEYSLLQGSEIRLTGVDVCHLEGVEYQFKGSLRRVGALGLLQLARTYLGAPYLWGGKTTAGIDCSGFVQQVFLMCGLRLPRDASQQELEGEEVGFKEVQEGDLAFFSNDKGKVIHVGICLSGNEIIHAHGELRIDALDASGIFNIEKNYYSHRLTSIKRVLFK